MPLSNDLSGAVVSVARGIFSAASATGDALAGVAGAIRSLATDTAAAGVRLVRSITSLGMGLVAALGTVIDALALALRSSVWSMAELAKSAASIRANTGMGYGQGGDLINRYGAFGIGAKEVGGIFSAQAMNPLLAGIRNAVTGGLSPSDRNYLPDAARGYQNLAASGPFGRLPANQRLDMQFGGQAPDSVRAVMNLPVQKIPQPVQWQQTTQASLGVTPDMIRRFAENIPLLQNRIGSLWEMIKVRFAGEPAPFFEKILGGIANYVSQNADKIADAIKTAARRLMVEAPALVLSFASGVVHGLAMFLKGTGAFLTGLAGNTVDILKVLDAILNGFRFFAGVMAGVATAIIQIVSDLWKRFKKGEGPLALVETVGKKVNEVTGRETKDPISNLVTGGVTLTGVGVVLRHAIPAAFQYAATRAGASAAATAAGTAAAGAGAAGAGAGAAGAGAAGSFAAAGTGATIGATIGATAPGVAGGALAGYGLYRAGQAVGLIDRTQGFGDRLATGWGRARDLFTLNPGQYDRSVQDAAYASAVHDKIEKSRMARITGDRAHGVPGDAWGAFAARDGRGALDAFRDGRAAFSTIIPQSDLAGKYGADLSDLLAKGGTKATDASKTLDGLSADVDDKAKAWRTEMLKVLSGIESNTGKTAGATDRSNQLLALLRDSAVPRGMAYIAEDSFLNLTRAT